MAKVWLSKDELMLAKLVDWVRQIEENSEIAKTLEKAKNIKIEKVWIKSESTKNRTKLWTEVAASKVKKEAKLKQQNDRIEFIEKRDKMFSLTECKDEYKRLFNWLDPKQQSDIIKYFYEALEDKENNLADVASWERFPTDWELQIMKFLKWYLYLYYAWINEKLAFIKLNQLPFVWTDSKIADIWRMIESRFTGQGTLFSSEWEKIDIAFKAKLEELKSKTKDIRYSEDIK